MLAIHTRPWTLLLRARWHAAVLLAAGVGGVLSAVEGSLLGAFVYAESAPNAITTALPLAFAGQAAHLVCSEETDYLADTGCAGRVRSARIVVLTLATFEFLLAWLAICVVWYTSIAIGLGVRNFGIGLATAAVVRALGHNQAFVVAPLFWMFPAILPGTGAFGEILGVAMRSAQPAFDLWTGSLMSLFAIGLVGFHSDLRSLRH